MHPLHRGLRPNEAFTLLALSALWGASFLFIKVALRGVGPLMLVAVRVGLAALGLSAYLLVTLGRSGVRRSVARVRPRDAAVLGVTASALPYVLISWAETRITSSLAGILNAALPLMTALLAFRFDPLERLRGWRNLGLVGGFAGVALVAGADLSGQTLAVLAMFAAVLSYAISAHFAKRRFAGVEPSGVALLQMAVSFVAVLPFALVFELPDHVPSPQAIGSLVVLGLGGTALAWVLYYWLLERAGPQQAVAVSYLNPVFAVVYGRLLLDERLTPLTLVGAAVIIAGELVTAVPSRSRADERRGAAAESNRAGVGDGRGRRSRE